MPNWVENKVTLVGDEKTISAVKEQLNKTLPAYTDSDGKACQKVDPIFSFWNIIAPPLDKLEEYHGTHGYAEGKKLGDTKYNWYPWNNANWGTKWDASEVSLETDTPTGLVYYFNTAWSPPDVFTALSLQHPTLQITLRYEEEQGWGGEVFFQNGTDTIEDEWDVPNTHEEEMTRRGSCSCDGYTDEDDFPYTDCPRPISTASAVAELEDISELLVSYDKN